MNPLSSLSCRTFQTAFRAAIPVLPYREPSVLESVDGVPFVLEKEGKRKPLIVTDANLASLGLVDLLTDALVAANIPYSVYDGTLPNPTIANVEAARLQYLDEGCDCLIAFGGGSPMDCAKATGARIAKPHQPVQSMRGILRIHARTPLLIAIPTTAGTGSETTLAAVITDADSHYKYPINDFFLIPDYAVLDARTTEDLPPHITAATGLDALVHATEAYIGRSTTAKTRAWAEEAVRLIDEYLLRAYKDGHDAEAREGMLRAAFVAGEAFSMSYVGYVHGVAHSLGGNYGVPHGLANAVICPYVLDMYGHFARPRLSKLARACGIAPAGADVKQAAAAYIAWFRGLNEAMGIPEKIDAIREEDIPAMAKQAATESNPLYPVPKLMNRKELEQIYRVVMVQEDMGSAADAAKTASIEDIVSRQRAFFQSRKTLDVDYRIQALARLKRAIADHEVEIEFALRDDLGKSFSEGYMCEVGLTLSELRHQIGHVRGWAKPHGAMTDLANFYARSFTVAEPYGVALVMSPWNYPFMLTMEPLIGAVAAGNCCVVKPSAYSPATSRIIARIVREAFEPGHVDCVLGGREENAELLDQRFDYIFFTGSEKVGKLVQEKAAANLTPTTLELGGKSPCIVAADADLAVAAKRIAFGKWLNVGQTCVAPDYVLVDKRVEARFAEELVKAVVTMYGANAFDNPDYGHMVNEKHFQRVTGLIDPAKVVLGGESRQETLQIEPTIMMNVAADDAIMQEEIFGPVLPLISVDSMEEAAAFVKARKKPLALYLFTNDQDIKQRFVREVPFGGGCINDTIMHIATSHMPFGGVGSSGMGQYHGKASFDTFSHTKSMLDKATWLDLPMRYQPYGRVKDSLVRMFVH